MTSTEIIQRAFADGVFIAVDGTESIKLTGDQHAVNKWLPALRENKAFILAVLSPRPPAPCQRCKRLEVIQIMGAAVSGCLYHAAGPYPDGWQRLPADMKKCMWDNPTQPKRINQ